MYDLEGPGEPSGTPRTVCLCTCMRLDCEDFGRGHWGQHVLCLYHISSNTIFAAQDDLVWARHLPMALSFHFSNVAFWGHPGIWIWYCKHSIWLMQEISMLLPGPLPVAVVEVIVYLFVAIMGVATITMGLPSWPAQAICGLLGKTAQVINCWVMSTYIRDNKTRKPLDLRAERTVRYSYS